MNINDFRSALRLTGAFLAAGALTGLSWPGGPGWMVSLVLLALAAVMIGWGSRGPAPSVATPPAPAPAPAPAPGAVVPSPASEVSSGLVFGLVSSSGSSLDYARGDHAHGTPELSGDVVTLLASGAQRVRIVQLQGRELNASNPQAGDVLSFDGQRWVASPPAVR